MQDLEDMKNAILLSKAAMPYLSTSTVFFYSILPFVSYGLSQVGAEALYDGITLFNRDYYNSSRGPGQITKTVVALGEPAGKPIKTQPKNLLKIKAKV